MRRGVAVVILIVVILLIALGVHSCQVSATDSALQDYTNNVSSLITQSNQTGTQLFNVLASAAGNNATTVQNSVNQSLGSAQRVLSKAQALNVPDQVRTAHDRLLLALRMRVDGISNIALHIQTALGSSATKASINELATETARLYASDVLYKDYASPEIYAALHAANTRFGGLPAGQFVPDYQWVDPKFIASELHVTIPGISPAPKFTPGNHGHGLTSVQVAGVTLQTGSTNTIPANPAPTFTFNFSNTGQFNETNVICKVTVSGSSDSGTTTVPQTNAGQPATCTVKLKSPPPTGSQTVVATVEKVPGESTMANNVLSFPVTFQ
ncbi:MAG: hypothetical protein WBQ18_00205 [Solirubrobacteraceae bacterium]